MRAGACRSRCRYPYRRVIRSIRNSTVMVSPCRGQRTCSPPACKTYWITKRIPVPPDLSRWTSLLFPTRNGSKRVRVGRGDWATSGGDLIKRHPRAGFASIRSDEGHVISVGRVVIDEGWAGLSTAAVHPEHRRQGLATALLLARLRWANSRYNATQAYLQVERHNTASLTLSRKVGFVHHHDYHYRTRKA